MYLIGEALVGKEPEIAHVDLIIGTKDGPVGQAFANNLGNYSAGHTPLLAVVRPNLATKPYTLVIPKVTVQDISDAAKIFGPAQAGVGKAVVDAVEEGVIPKDVLDDWVVLCSVFVHPDAKDYRKIYQYNYGATKLAIKRALTKYPSLEKIMFDKDRATHPIMGFRIPRLWMPPYLQIALDIPNLERTKRIITEVPKSDRVIFEAGTPLIKKYGTSVIQELRDIAKNVFIVADLKTLDVGQVEVDLAFDETADAVVASGLASLQTLERFIYEAKRLGIYAYIDMMDVASPVKVLESLKELPDVVILHRGIDAERGSKTRWDLIKEIKTKFKDARLLVAVAGGIEPSNVTNALKAGADILIVGRYITQSKDIEHSAEEFLTQIGLDMDIFRVHTE